MSDGPYKRKLILGAGWAMGMKGMAGLLLFANDALLARLIPVDDVGTYFLCFSLVTMTSIVSILGLDKAVVQGISESLAIGNKSRAWWYARTSILVVSTTSLCAAILIGGPIGRQYINSLEQFSRLVNYTTPLAVWIVFYAIQLHLAEVFRGYHDIKLASAFGGAIRNAIMCVILLTCFFREYQPSLSVILWAAVISNSCSLVLAFIFVGKKKGGTTATANKTSFGFVLASLPLMILAFSQAGLREMHLWVTASMTTTAQVSLLGVIIRFANLLGTPVVLIGGVIQPSIPALNQIADRRRLQKILQSAATIAAIPGTLVCVGLMIFPELALKTIYGPEYAAASIGLAIMGVAQIINLVTGSPAILMMMSGRRLSVMAIGLVCGTLGLIVTILLVRKLGYLGAAIGYASGIAVQNIIYWSYCCFGMKVRTNATLSVVPTILSAFKVRAG